MEIPYLTKTKTIDLANLTPDDICAEDIACSLAGQARFNGITRPLYSVAQHSVLCSKVAPKGFELAALLHDAHEYILGDIAGPSTKFIEYDYQYKHCIWDCKHEFDRKIEKRFNLNDQCFRDSEISTIDARMLATEMLYFFGKNYTKHEPYENVLTEVWGVDLAEKIFLKRLGELTND